MTTRALATVFHVSALSYMIWGYVALGSVLVDSEILMQRGGNWQFLTIQGLALSWVTLSLCILSDVSPRSTSLAAARRFLLMMALPLEVVVAAIYWSLIYFMPRLMVPTIQNPTTEPTSASPPLPALFFIPLPIDLALHLSPVLALLLHFFVLEAKYSVRWVHQWAPVVATGFAMWYSAFAEWCALENKTFPYPFLNVQLPFRLAIYATSTLIAISSFKGLNRIHKGKALVPSVYGIASSVLEVKKE
ncbi:hypothetical protein FRC04_011139 [Tulasnella sp. 424]|nr:hypothetical protein FRC04_011139 [Tulasnella sp. 424]